MPAICTDLSVVVPAYNEEERLGPTLEAITAYLRDDEGRLGSWEVVVVDDGSTDGTRDVVTTAGAGEERVRLVIGDRNRAKGHALRLGVLATSGHQLHRREADRRGQLAGAGPRRLRGLEGGGAGAATAGVPGPVA
ncbi:glycosyltransferase [Streptomyces sp. NPDC051104]|uniref:glycosyltransferase n=1 Tax=Streptomyces sp. NPDC051104 TaxID=3155044 RepID=UPI0034450689